MRSVRFRLTTRRIMAVVVVAALVSAGYIWRGLLILREGYQNAVEYCAENEATQQAQVNGIERCRRQGTLANDPLVEIIEHVARLRVDHYATLKAKYRRAVARPWAHVEADPPEPTDRRMSIPFDEYVKPAMFFIDDIPQLKSNAH
jgi:hypothetical protein